VKSPPLIAVIDDDASLRQALSSLLRSYDINSEKFGRAEELLAYPSLEDFSCFLTDVVMPGLSGFELIEILHAKGHMQPTILMTAYKRDGYAAKALELGVTCLISKPFTTEDIMACVEDALSTGGATDQAPH